MSHVLKFKAGQKVRIVNDTYDHHMDMGEESIITATYLESREGDKGENYQEYVLRSGRWVTEEDIELVE